MTTVQPPFRALAIVAGGGAFPNLVGACARAMGIDVFAVRLDGHADADTLAGYDGISVHPEQMGRVFAALRARNIRDLVLIGRMRRPHLLSLRPDMTTLRILPKLIPALCFKGDDALLKAVRGILESEGFALHAAQEFISDLTADAGVMGRHAPNDEASHDIAVGASAARALGRRDAGQAVIVRGGIVLGQEDRAGTDALIKAHGDKGAVLVKMSKPQQDRALDLPSIGIDTVRLCAAKGFAGIAVEAGAALVAEKKEVIDFADAHGLFLVGIT